MGVRRPCRKPTKQLSVCPQPLWHPLSAFTQAAHVGFAISTGALRHAYLGSCCKVQLAKHLCLELDQMHHGVEHRWAIAGSHLVFKAVESDQARQNARPLWGPGCWLGHDITSFVCMRC